MTSVLEIGGRGDKISAVHSQRLSRGIKSSHCVSSSWWHCGGSWSRSFTFKSVHLRSTTHPVHSGWKHLQLDEEVAVACLSCPVMKVQLTWHVVVTLPFQPTHSHFTSSLSGLMSSCLVIWDCMSRQLHTWLCTVTLPWWEWCFQMEYQFIGLPGKPLWFCSWQF